VANFFDYIKAGRYTDAIFHRHETSGIQVLQGGGFTFRTNPARLDPIATPADFGIKNEPDFVNRPNALGTIAMAKSTTDNANSQFFFNLANNTALNDPAQSGNTGGFTVFGKIADATSQQNLNDLAAIPIQNRSNDAALPASEKTVFGQIPLKNYPQPPAGNFPTDTVAANYALITGADVLKQDEFLTYSVVSNSRPDLVTPVITNEHLTLKYATNKTGNATITVRATDKFGATVDDTFTVSVANTAPTATVTLSSTSPKTNDTLTATATPHDADGDPVSLTYVWKVNGVVEQTTTTSATTNTFDLSQANHGNKGQTVTVEVTPNDGTLNGAVATPATPATIINSAPVINTIGLSPNTAVNSNDNLTATVTATDPDGDPITFSYLWEKQGGGTLRGPISTTTTHDALDLSTLSGIAKNDQIKLTVTPNDGTVNGTAASTSVTIANTAPTVSVNLDTNSPVPSATLTATATPADAENDPVTLTFVWKVNGTVVPSATTNTFDLAANGAGPGAVVTVTVTPNDGHTNGAAQTATATVNSPPQTTGIQDQTFSGPGNFGLDVTPDFSDPDAGDTLTYTATLSNNAPLPTWLHFTAGVFSGNPAPSDAAVLQIKVVASDPHSQTASATFQLTVSNTPTSLNDAPVIDDVTLSPNPVHTTDTLTATVTSHDPDGDPVGLSFVWKVDGTPTGVTTSTFDLQAHSVASGSVVRVEVTPNDGTVDGAVFAKEITVS
jgi:cyclophilin family peptidyl-prolyl cis-trans isomerase